MHSIPFHLFHSFHPYNLSPIIEEQQQKNENTSQKTVDKQNGGLPSINQLLHPRDSIVDFPKRQVALQDWTHEKYSNLRLFSALKDSEHPFELTQEQLQVSEPPLKRQRTAQIVNETGLIDDVDHSKSIELSQEQLQVSEPPLKRQRTAQIVNEAGLIDDVNHSKSMDLVKKQKRGSWDDEKKMRLILYTAMGIEQAIIAEKLSLSTGVISSKLKEIRASLPPNLVDFATFAFLKVRSEINLPDNQKALVKTVLKEEGLTLDQMRRKVKFADHTLAERNIKTPADEMMIFLFDKIYKQNKEISVKMNLDPSRVTKKWADLLQSKDPVVLNVIKIMKGETCSDEYLQEVLTEEFERLASEEGVSLSDAQTKFCSLYHDEVTPAYLRNKKDW